MVGKGQGGRISQCTQVRGGCKSGGWDTVMHASGSFFLLDSVRAVSSLFLVFC
jgi:hypothetical protein